MGARFADVVAAGREEAIAAARARLASTCEHCGQPTGGPRIPCADLDCQAAAEEMYRPYPGGQR